MSMDSVQITAMRKEVPLPLQRYVIERDRLKAKETTRARLFIPLKENKRFTLKVSSSGKTGQVIIGEKYLQ